MALTKAKPTFFTLQSKDNKHQDFGIPLSFLSLFERLDQGSSMVKKLKSKWKYKKKNVERRKWK